jgi:hypothetical protein
MISPNLIVLVVTQIPLDSPTSPHDFIISSVRPPWIRPARKKNPPVFLSAGSVESPPQDTSEFTSEFAGDRTPIAPANIPFSPTTGLSPVMSSSSQLEFSAVTASYPGPLLNPAGVGTVTSGLEMFMPSEELMSLFGDSDVDVEGLFPPSALPGFTTDRPGDAPYGEDLARRGSQGPDEMAGLVTSP